MTIYIHALVVLIINLTLCSANYCESGKDDCSQMGSIAKVFVVGASGEIGKQLVDQIIKNPVVEKVVLIGRRKLDNIPDNIEQSVIDFDNIDKLVFSGFDQGFICLGTTRGKAGKEGFYKVDHDYIVGVAEAAKESGTKHLHLISSSGANANSYFYYPQVKGETENDLINMKFPKLSIYRPAFLVCDRTERRFMEKAALCLLKPVIYMAPTLLSVPTTSVAKAMLYQAIHGQNEEYKIFENAPIHTLAADYDKLKTS